MEKQHKSNKAKDQTIQKKGEQRQNCCRLKRKLQRQKSVNPSSSKFFKHDMSQQTGARGQIWLLTFFYRVHKIRMIENEKNICDKLKLQLKFIFQCQSFIGTQPNLFVYYGLWFLSCFKGRIE